MKEVEKVLRVSGCYHVTTLCDEFRRIKLPIYFWANTKTDSIMPGAILFVPGTWESLFDYFSSTDFLELEASVFAKSCLVMLCEKIMSADRDKDYHYYMV